MWVVAGVLLGLVVLGVVGGFHLGPHGHGLAALAGVAAACWLVAMAALGYARPLLYLLLGADLAVSAGVGALALAGLRHRRRAREGLASLESELGVATTPLDPDGVVRVRGETWSATSLNGYVPAGATVQVIRARGVRLEVWGEGSPQRDALGPPPQRASRPTKEPRP
ncbi:MAG TPA: NfeD family protein [Acidimicrobiales bacterium]|nr:NfeD family protein [Acidimicrobiales bacterium]